MRPSTINFFDVFTVLTPTQAPFYGGVGYAIQTGIANADGLTATSGRVLRVNPSTGIANAAGLVPTATVIESGNVTSVSPAEGIANADGLTPTADIFRTIEIADIGAANADGLTANAAISPVVTVDFGVAHAVGMTPTLTFGTFEVRTVNMSTGVANASGLEMSANRISSIWIPIEKVTNNVWSRA